MTPETRVIKDDHTENSAPHAHQESQFMRTKNSLAILLLIATAALTTTNLQGETTPRAVSRSQVVELPHGAGSGDGKEVAVLLDESHLKLATITLRLGTILPAHSAPVPATVQVLEGEGVMHVGGEAVPVSKGTVVSLAAGEEHDVVPEPGSDMLLLVHYLRGAQGNTPPPPPGHEH